MQIESRTTESSLEMAGKRYTIRTGPGTCYGGQPALWIGVYNGAEESVCELIADGNEVVEYTGGDAAIVEAVEKMLPVLQASS